MSGFSSSVDCPNCGNSADFHDYTKPFDYSTISCLHCGLIIEPKIRYLTLKELNQLRLDAEMDKIERATRPPQNHDLWE